MFIGKHSFSSKLSANTHKLVSYQLSAISFGPVARLLEVLLNKIS
ncbi:hypothetical protein [Moorena sp. SIO2C4]|nr:hypothetical protein [Moorena sp. SIO2C4]